MRKPAEREEIKKEVILKNCFECIIKHGIEKVSIRTFSEATGMTLSSLYYWFKDKDEIILDSTEYGIKEIVDKLFEYAMENVQDVKKMCEEFPKIVKKYENTLKAIFQIATSPQYGKKIIKLTDGFSGLYDIYAQKLSEQLSIPYDYTRQLVNLFISSIVDCVTWSEWEKLSMEIDMILHCLSLQTLGVDTIEGGK